MNKHSPSRKSLLCGFGLDSQDGHVRLTKGQNFFLMGGSKKTHSLMQEKVIKFNEQLKKHHKTLEEIDEKEFMEIGEKVGLKPLPVKISRRIKSQDESSQN